MAPVSSISSCTVFWMNSSKESSCWRTRPFSSKYDLPKRSAQRQRRVRTASAQISWSGRPKQARSTPNVFLCSASKKRKRAPLWGLKGRTMRALPRSNQRRATHAHHQRTQRRPKRRQATKINEFKAHYRQTTFMMDADDEMMGHHREPPHEAATAARSLTKSRPNCPPALCPPQRIHSRHPWRPKRYTAPLFLLRAKS